MMNLAIHETWRMHPKKYEIQLGRICKL
jgi:hypothetical protein